MADQTASPVSESPGAFYPQDFNIQKITLLTDAGQTFDLKNMMYEFCYFEDIYSFAVSGYVMIKDAVGIIENFRLNGNEFIEISFSKAKGADDYNTQTYRVYKAGNRKPSGNLMSEKFTLYFCSEEMVLSEQVRISKSYPGKEIYKIVNDVLVNKLKVPAKRVNIEPTKGVYDFIVPRMKPFETISWLSTYARPASQSIGADMLFFENKNGFNFRSLTSMMSGPVYATYKYEQKNVSSPDKADDFNNKIKTVLNYQFVKVYDALNEISSGTYANKLISMDPLTRNYKITNFDYSVFQNKLGGTNTNGILSPAVNRLGFTQNQAYDSVIKVAFGNADEKRDPYVAAAEAGVGHDIYIETYVPFRTAQISLANYTVIKMTIPGDPNLLAGSVITFNLYSLNNVSTGRELDKFHSGNYLVTSVRHVIQDTNVYQCIVEIAKGSSPTGYGSGPSEMTATTDLTSGQ